MPLFPPSPSPTGGLQDPHPTLIVIVLEPPGTARITTANFSGSFLGGATP
ncbi:hypothetical protein AOQ84DRAFT_382419 [Glonium stellatum]|uniref:Uncharacterized protein n=1 Tax=Glonium stellatum TaxID=574774 RepID=A0A8E2EQD2_9PEZI|nr:hypothetical protein AOQ84DRAFT_382419 [Glonium stellatum]